MEREKDGKDNAKHISMELTADGARVTSLSLRGSRLILTIEAELADSQLNTSAEVQSTAGGRSQSSRSKTPGADTQLLVDSLLENATSPELEDSAKPTPPPAVEPKPIMTPAVEPEPVAPPIAEPDLSPPPIGEPKQEEQKTAVVAEDSLMDIEEESVPGFAPEEGAPELPAEEEDVMGGLPISSYQAPEEPEPIKFDDAIPVPSLAEEKAPSPSAAPQPNEETIASKPSASAMLRREVLAKSISMDEEPIQGILQDVPGFAPSGSVAATPAAAPDSLDLGFAPPQQAPEAAPAQPDAKPASQQEVEDSFDILGFAPAFQDAPAPAPAKPVSSPVENTIELGGLDLATDDNAWTLRDEPPPAPPLEPVREASETWDSPKPPVHVHEPQAPAPKQESARSQWGPAPELSLSAAPEKSGRENWDAPLQEEAAPSRPGSAWGDDVPMHAADSEKKSPMPVTETWDAEGLHGDTFPAISEESNAVGGARHGEPQPAMAYGVAPESPPRAVENKAEDAGSAGVLLNPQKGEAPAAPAVPPAGRKDSDPGGTTVLIRYTCPKCKTQGMQAVDKVGTVVNCSNCGKAMRLVMKK